MNELLNFINTSNNKPYKIVLLSPNNEDELFEMINDEKNGCHKISRDFRELFGENTVELFVVIALSDNKLASYLAFSIEESEAFQERFVMLKISCTSIDFRRRGLSVLLRLIPIYFAAENKIQFIASDANKESGALLQKKFGFTVTPDYLEQFNYDANSFIDIFSSDAKKMIKDYQNRLL